MLYTTYISNIGEIPDGMKKVLIVRFMPKSFKKDKYPEIEHNQALSPSQALLLKYKEEGDWDWYVKRFHWEMENRTDMKQALSSLIESLELEIGFGRYKNMTPTEMLLNMGDPAVIDLKNILTILEKHTEQYPSNNTKIKQIKAAIRDYTQGILEEKSKDICLICYEKDYVKCHRYLIAKWMESKGIEWKELESR